MRRRLLFLTAAASAITIAWLLWPSHPGPVSRANLQLITMGMTEADVETLLGGPADVEAEVPYPGTYDNADLGVTAKTSQWFSRQLTIQVGFDERGLVIWKSEWMPPVALRD